MCQEINYIRAVIDNYDVSLTWLAKRINEKYIHAGMTKQRLSYIKECGKEISTTLYKQIRSIFDEHNFILSDFDHAGIITKEVSQLNLESAQLVNTAFESADDFIFNDTERADLLMKIAKIDERSAMLKKILMRKQ